MICWNCGQPLPDGAAFCPYCGTKRGRPAPVTETGRAMRALFDRCGAQTVLTDESFLANGLGELGRDGRKLRNQLSMAMEAGVGRLYLEQLEKQAPDEAFDRRVRSLLTEEAGLNDKAAAELASLFDEMIGWRAAAAPRKAAAPKRAASSETTVRVRKAPPKPGPARTEPQETGRTAEKGDYRWKDLYVYEKTAVFCILAAVALGFLLNPGKDFLTTVDYVLCGLPLIPFFLSFGVTKDKLRVGAAGLPVGLTVLLGLIVLGAGLDLGHKIKILDAMGAAQAGSEAYLLQQHLKTEDSILLVTLLLLLLVMLRHRWLERKKEKSGGHDK